MKIKQKPIKTGILGRLIKRLKANRNLKNENIFHYRNKNLNIWQIQT
jgi:hypothetical protein